MFASQSSSWESSACVECFWKTDSIFEGNRIFPRASAEQAGKRKAYPKSFSAMAALKPILAAVFRNSSRRSLSGNRTAFLIVCRLHPFSITVCCVTRATQPFTPQSMTAYSPCVDPSVNPFTHPFVPVNPFLALIKWVKRGHIRSKTAKGFKSNQTKRI